MGTSRAPERRKRARRPRGAAAASAAGGAPVAAPAPAWESHEETLVFPADSAAAPAAHGKIVLPSSGTAEEILARAASGAGGPSAKAVSARPAAEAAPAAQPTLSFFTSAQAREEAKAAAVATEHLATFFLVREEYGVDVRLVQEIIRVAEITQVPRAPEFISGVINLRGRVIPVIDLKRKLGLGVFELARGSRIVVVKVRERLIGLLVDGASQVLKVPLSVIEAAPDEVVEIDQNFIRGVAKLEGRLIILIDLPKVLQVELREALPGEPE